MSRLSSASENVNKARDLMKSAKESITTGMLRWKPDFEKGAHLFQDAARSFRLAGPDFALSQIEALAQSADCFNKISSYQTAGKNFEAAAAEAAKIRGEEKRVAELYSQAAQNYRLAENHDKAAATLVKAGRGLGDIDKDLATKYFMDALSIFEDENRGVFSNDSFKSIIGWLLKNERFDDAVSVIKRQNVIYQKIGGHDPYLYKNFLALVVLYLQMEKFDEAENEQKANFMVGNYGTSDECGAAEELLEAMRMASNEMLKKATKMQVFTFLDNEVGRVARGLYFDEDKLKHRVPSEAAGPVEDDDPYGLK